MWWCRKLLWWLVVESVVAGLVWYAALTRPRRRGPGLPAGELWTGGEEPSQERGQPTADARQLERMLVADAARVIPALGYGGDAVDFSLFTEEERRLGNLSTKKEGLNVIVSNRMPLDRYLRDFRAPECALVQYPEDLPSASVVIVFCEEPLSVLLRTVHSVLNTLRLPTHNDTQHGNTRSDGGRSEYGALVEVILVDDHSARRELRDQLTHYVATRLPAFVSIIRLRKRLGVAGARAAGARGARGEVLVFLDAHCEAARGWLPPLLRRLARRPQAVVMPLLDTIHYYTFQYKPDNLRIGGFDMSGNFRWIEIPERDQQASPITEPIPTPTMVGGVFAVRRRYFWEAGGYDERMRGWGGENIEMSFRVWMCGGQLEVAACSRVGHLDRGAAPYPHRGRFFQANTGRAAEVWMDDYKEIFYLHHPGLKNSAAIGDVRSRRAVRARLRCRPFQWYLDRVHPQKVEPLTDILIFGRLALLGGAWCLAVRGSWNALRLGRARCPAETFAFTSRGLLLARDTVCAHIETAYGEDAESLEGRTVKMQECDDAEPGQKWRLTREGALVNEMSGLCVAAAAGDDVTLEQCGPQHDRRWRFITEQYQPYMRGDARAAAVLVRLAGSRLRGRNASAAQYTWLREPHAQ